MSGFKDMVQTDIKNVFLNNDEFAELHTVVYDDTTYKDVSIVITKVREKERQQLVWDHAQGLYLVTAVAHIAATDLGGIVPEKGMKIKINDSIDKDFFMEYYVASSANEMGMIRLELEAIDE